jgi:hypothetical protein
VPRNSIRLTACFQADNIKITVKYAKLGLTTIQTSTKTRAVINEIRGWNRFSENLIKNSGLEPSVNGYLLPYPYIPNRYVFTLLWPLRFGTYSATLLVQRTQSVDFHVHWLIRIETFWRKRPLHNRALISVLFLHPSAAVCFFASVFGHIFYAFLSLILNPFKHAASRWQCLHNAIYVRNNFCRFLTINKEWLVKYMSASLIFQEKRLV